MSLERFPGPASRATRVLVVDDQAAIRTSIYRQLSGHLGARGDIACAATLGEARGLVTAWRPDLVLLDVDLAGEDGLRLVPELTPATRVIVVTSHADQDDRRRARRAGARWVIGKQQGLADLLRAVDQALSPYVRGDLSPATQGGSSVGGPAPAAYIESVTDCGDVFEPVRTTEEGFMARWWKDESGVTAIEYGLLAALISLVIVGSVSTVSTNMGLIYDKWSSAVVAAISAAL